MTRRPLYNIAPAVERLKQIAAEAGDHLLLGDGPVHPDAKLLDLCADIVHERKRLEMARTEGSYWDLRAAHRRLTKLAIAAGKVPARTPAGIYGKATAVQAARYAARLGQSLAEDLLANRPLRALLWSHDAAASIRSADPAEEARS